MNRSLVGFAVVTVGLFINGCAPGGVGDPCTPNSEFDVTQGAESASELTIDPKSVECTTRVCLADYFQGRVTCPYGNGDGTGMPAAAQQTVCYPVSGYRGWYTVDGTQNGQLCCPVVNDPNFAAIQLPVPAQCQARPAADAVYCTCRCGIPDSAIQAGVDPSTINLCSCPDGYACTDICDQTHGGCSNLPVGDWGSYCVKSTQLGYQDPTDAKGQCNILESPIQGQPGYTAPIAE